MKRTFKFVVAGALATVALVSTGCQDTRPVERDGYREGTGGSGELGRNPGVEETEFEENRVGEPRLGDGKIGNNNGVIDDGEGPLEGNGVADDKIGEKPGVWNDGEGPIENTEADRPEAQ